MEVIMVGLWCDGYLVVMLWCCDGVRRHCVTDGTWWQFKLMLIAVADLGRGCRDPPPVQFLSFSCILQEKIGQIIGFCPTFGFGGPPPPVWEILDPPLDWSAWPSSMLFKFSHWSTQWMTASASPSPSTITVFVWVWGNCSDDEKIIFPRWWQIQAVPWKYILWTILAPQISLVSCNVSGS